jgi:hypothetical protein
MNFCMRENKENRKQFYFTANDVSSTENHGDYKEHEPSLICTQFVSVVLWAVILLWRYRGNSIVFMVRGCENLWKLRKNDTSVWRKLYEPEESLRMGGRSRGGWTSGVDDAWSGRSSTCVDVKLHIDQRIRDNRNNFQVKEAYGPTANVLFGCTWKLADCLTTYIEKQDDCV